MSWILLLNQEVEVQEMEVGEEKHFIFQCWDKGNRDNFGVIHHFLYKIIL